MTESEIKDVIEALALNPPTYTIAEFMNEIKLIIKREPSLSEIKAFQMARAKISVPLPKISGPLPIGIDLGTTYSCVAVWRNDTVEIIPNEQGQRTTPSWVAFTGDGRLVGYAARNNGINDSKNSLFDSKRMIGRWFTDSEVQQDMKQWPFNVVQRAGMPVYSVMYQGQRKKFTPVEISSMVLEKLKGFAETYLGYPVTDAVITCPAAFSDSQRQATKDAGRVAGLNVLQIINEPTATAIAYGLNSGAENANIMVFDYGGGTVDVSILTLKSGLFEVKATAGNSHLGGQDIDMLLVNEMVAEFKRKFGKDLTSNARSVGRLRAACESAKQILSSQTQTTIELDGLFDQKDFTAVLTRARLNVICEEQFRRCMEPVERALADSKLKVGDISEMVLVGGSSRIPRIQELLKARFGGKEMCRSINPDEAIAYGAAVQAAVIKKTIGWKGKDMLLVDVTPLSLGIELKGGLMSVIVKRNTPIPTSSVVQNDYCTVDDYQKSVTISVFEGERDLVAGNNLLGEFSLDGLTPELAGVTKMDVKFDIDVNGILEVTATESSTTNSKKITVANLSGRLKEDEIQRMVKEAQAYAQDDRRRKQTIEARNELEGVAFSLRTALSEGRTKLSGASKGLLDTRVKETIAWLAADRSGTSKDEYAARTAELKLWLAKL